MGEVEIDKEVEENCPTPALNVLTAATILYDVFAVKYAPLVAVTTMVVTPDELLVVNDTIDKFEMST